MSQSKLFRGAVALGISVGAVLSFTSSPLTAGSGAKGHGHGNAHQAARGSMSGHMGAETAKMNHATPGGMKGDPAKIDRTVLIIANDTKFNLKKIQVKNGETIRFVIKNKGELVHEMTIGTPDIQQAHQAEMLKMMEEGHLMADMLHGNMNHSHGNSVLVGPGKKAELIWKFHKGASVEFGCNVPGHYLAGMKGHFVIGG